MHTNLQKGGEGLSGVAEALAFWSGDEAEPIPFDVNGIQQEKKRKQAIVTTNTIKTNRKQNMPAREHSTAKE